MSRCAREFALPGGVYWIDATFEGRRRMNRAIRAMILAMTCVIGLAACTIANPGPVDARNTQMNPSGGGGGGY
jgi:hypothetical protein